jgi:hypothetical protein
MGRLGSRLTTLSMRGRENRYIKRAAEFIQQLFVVLLITFLLLLLVESIWERSVSSYLSLDYLLIAVIVVGVTAVLTRREREEIDEATERHGLGVPTIRGKFVGEPESGSKSVLEDANEVKPRTTYVWDRSKKAWVKEIEKPTVEKFSTANGSETRGSVLTRSESVRAKKGHIGRRDIMIAGCAGLAGTAIVWYKTKEIGWLSYVISVISGGLIVLLFMLVWREPDEEVEGI